MTSACSGLAPEAQHWADVIKQWMTIDENPFLATKPSFFN
jgi:hypothetical protein